MAAKVIMPKLGLTMVEGTVIKWLKNEGDRVEKDEPLLEVQSDKSSFEIEAPESGVLRVILASNDTVVPCGDIIGVIAEVEEDISEFIQGVSDNEQKEEKSSEASTVSSPLTSDTTEIVASDKRVKISPRAKKLAKQENIDYTQIEGTGPNGRIIEKDIKAFMVMQSRVKATPLALKIAREKGVALAQVKGSGVSGRINKADVESLGKTGDAMDVETVVEEDNVEIVPYKGMRKVIGDRLSQSKFTSPHVYFTVAVDMSKSQEIRETLKKRGEKVSFNDIVIYAVSRSLLKHPVLNSSLIGDNINYYKYVNVGMAVALEAGLIVPVIRNAHKKNLLEIANEAKNLALKAKNNQLTPDEYKGGTFTVSNLGMAGIDNFTAIINPPETAILAVSAIKKKAIVNEETDEIEIKPMMNITVSVDHRIIDGMSAAEFLKTVKTYLEEPYCLL